MVQIRNRNSGFWCRRRGFTVIHLGSRCLDAGVHGLAFDCVVPCHVRWSGTGVTLAPVSPTLANDRQPAETHCIGPRLAMAKS